jgi:hypothetical protein
MDTLTNSMEQSPSWEADYAKLVEKFLGFYRTRRFITVFTTARNRQVITDTIILLFLSVVYLKTLSVAQIVQRRMNMNNEWWIVKDIDGNGRSLI